MKELIVSFVKQHGERLFFILFATVFATVMYYFIESTREQVVAVYFLLLGLIINKARSPKDEVEREPQEPKEPPSIIGNSGLSTLDTMTALSILVILAFVLVGYGCPKMVTKQDTAERIAVSLSAKALGQKLQGDFKWHPQIDAFVAMIEKDGVTLNSGQMAHNYLIPRIPSLYHREAKILFESVGFEFSGDSVVDVSRVNKTLLLEAVGAFKEGLLFRG